ncbi:aldehyde dehydrogenase family protein [Parasedimentitalea psychrophila]|uniref:Aldehyde dehydrogenase family protein n=1 Tax=Parasedimentitalea psychrophila TaxID=2997337 RepID=A0A9Y2L5Z7_9RHOB|nr:aldehyde dehydrogenase family protein [Parasedimentitalea psychrophila]
MFYDGGPRQVPSQTSTDVHNAAASARRAFDDDRWSRQSPAAREKVLFAIADRIEAEALSLGGYGRALTTSCIRKVSLDRTSGLGASDHLEALNIRSQAGSEVKAWSPP